MNRIITISGKIVFSLLLISFCTICLSAQTTTFSDLGDPDSGGAGFKTVGDNDNIFVSNNMTQDGSSIFLDVDGVNTTASLTIKAEGTSTKIFTFTDMTIVGFSFAEVANDSQIEFKDINGTTIQTMTLNVNKVLTMTNTAVTSFFDNGNSTPINNVAEIEFTFHSTDSSPNDLTLVDITLSDYALPVELTSFEGFATEDGVLLEWETATEVNNYGFQVQRKKEKGKSWEDVGFVEGYGNSNSPKNYEFTDSELPDCKAVSYRLKQIDTDGSFEYSEMVEVQIENVLPTEFTLEQNYPNPFNPTTKINFQLPAKGYVQLTVYDILGNEIQNLVNDFREAGSYNLEFDGSNLSSGVYFYSLLVDGKNIGINKMTVLK